ncbi:MAG: GNAT family N-acetyltransferase [Geminicoccaceae bacterium]
MRSTSPLLSPGPDGGFTVEPLWPESVPAVTALYRQHLADGTAGLPPEAPDPDAMRRWIGLLRAQGLPSLVALDARRRVLGFAWVAPFRFARDGDPTVETLVHVQRRHRERGVGASLIGGLLRGCARLGRNHLVAVVPDLGSRAALHLHRKLGFEPGGRFAVIGHRPDDWVDMLLLRRALQPAGC